jgi:hypothetical protein
MITEASTKEKMTGRLNACPLDPLTVNLNLIVCNSKNFITSYKIRIL